MLRRYINFLKKHPLITAVIAIIYAVICLKSLPTTTYFQGLVVRTLLCGAMAFFLYQISGDKTLAASYNSTGYVVKVAMGFWIFALPIGILGLLMSANSPVCDNVPLQMLTVFLMFVFVGLFEEMAFRAVINDAIVYQFRDKKYVFVLSAVCCSLVFGAAHVIGADLSTPLAWGQAVGKTISSGVFGLALLLLYWKTRNIWACGVVHGVYDFLLSLRLGLFRCEEALRVEYVVSGEAGKASILIYAVMTVIELFILWRVWRKIGKKIDYQEMRETW